jgi:hypothetical protein
MNISFIQNRKKSKQLNVKFVYVNCQNKPEDGSLTSAETCHLKYNVNTTSKQST